MSDRSFHKPLARNCARYSLPALFGSPAFQSVYALPMAVHTPDEGLLHRAVPASGPVTQLQVRGKLGSPAVEVVLAPIHPAPLSLALT